TGGAYESPGARWTVREGDALTTLASTPEQAEVLFWDPFSQSANPSLWTVAAFATALAHATADATLITYSSSTTARTALLIAGWWVAEGPLLERGRRTTSAGAGRLENPLGPEWLERRK